MTLQSLSIKNGVALRYASWSKLLIARRPGAHGASLIEERTTSAVRIPFDNSDWVSEVHLANTLGEISRSFSGSDHVLLTKAGACSQISAIGPQTQRLHWNYWNGEK